MKRRLLSMIAALALCLTLLPTPAWAAYHSYIAGSVTTLPAEDNCDRNGGQIGTNLGTIVKNESDGTVSINRGKVTSNYGTVYTNESGGVVDHNYNQVQTNSYGGTINTNEKGAQIGTNRATVTTNTGTVSTNESSGSVGYNTESGTIHDNYGGVASNGGTIGQLCGGTVSTNEDCGKISSSSGGTVSYNRGLIDVVGRNCVVTDSIGTVTNNYGTVKTNSAEGSIGNNHATVTTNRGKISNNGPDGTVGENIGTIHTNFGAVTTNSGTIQYNAGTVTTNSGTIENYPLTITGTDHGQITGLADPDWIPTAGASFSPKAGWTVKGTPTATGCDITANSDGSYSLSNVTGAVALTVDLEAAAPTITTQPVGMEIYVGQEQALTVAADLESVSYQWYDGGTPVSGAQGAALELKDLALGEHRIFCRVTNGDKSVDSDTVTVTVRRQSTLFSIILTDPVGSAYTYGDAINAYAMIASDDTGEAAVGQITLYYGEKPVSDPVSVNGHSCDLSTTVKALVEAGAPYDEEIALTAKFTDGDVLAAAEATERITLRKKAVTAEYNGLLTWTYDGKTTKTAGELQASESAPVFTLAGALEGDDVAVGEAAFTLDYPDAGARTLHGQITGGLTGADAGNYTLAAQTVDQSVTITQQPVESSNVTVSFMPDKDHCPQGGAPEILHVRLTIPGSHIPAYIYDGWIITDLNTDEIGTGKGSFTIKSGETDNYAFETTVRFDVTCPHTSGLTEDLKCAYCGLDLVGTVTVDGGQTANYFDHTELWGSAYNAGTVALHVRRSGTTKSGMSVRSGAVVTVTMDEGVTVSCRDPLVQVDYGGSFTLKSGTLAADSSSGCVELGDGGVNVEGGVIKNSGGGPALALTSIWQKTGRAQFSGGALEADVAIQITERHDGVIGDQLAERHFFQSADGSYITDPDVLNGKSLSGPVTVSKTVPVVTAPGTDPLTYTGGPQALVTPGSATGGTLQYSLDGTNYSADIPQGADAGSYTVYYKVVGDDKHESVDAQSVAVTIHPKPITGAVVALGDSPTYNGTEQTMPVASVTVDGLAATYEVVSGEKGTDAGDYTLTVAGSGNFTGTATKGWKILPAPLNGAAFAAIEAQNFTDQALTPEPAVTVDSKTLAAGTDFTCTYENNRYVGTATVKITGAGNYTGEATTTFAISPVPDPAVIVTTAAVAQGGKTVDLSGNITGALGAVSYELTGGEGAVNALGVYTSPARTGAATVTVTVAPTDLNGDGVNEYTGATAEIAVTVTQRLIDAAVANQTLTASLYAPEAGVVCCAEYNGNGTLLAIQLQSVDPGEQTVAFSLKAGAAAYQKVFLLGQSLAPQCPAKTVTP